MLTGKSCQKRERGKTEIKDRKGRVPGIMMRQKERDTNSNEENEKQTAQSLTDFVQLTNILCPGHLAQRVLATVYDHMKQTQTVLSSLAKRVILIQQL